MKHFKHKNIIILLLSIFDNNIVQNKKKTFNGTTTLDCPDYNPTKSKIKETNKKTKWKLVLYKDGKEL